jgi:XTP/dITP diphosphohydrolase
VSRRQFLIATRSAGKLREFSRIFAHHKLEVVDPAALGIAETAAEDDLEVFDNFEDNALAKARYFFERSGGVPTFADDSGLAVDALDGEPGVISKRWSGRSDLTGKALDAANNQMLTRRMLEAKRAAGSGFAATARYVCVAAFKDSAGEVIRRAEVEGNVLDAPRGDSGFGYDPYFDAPAVGGTFAELTIEETARLSHRSRAFSALIAALRAEGRL